MSETIQRFMTRTVHTIAARMPLSEAHRLMNEHGIRHLPVLHGGKLVGVVSQRDLSLVETLRDVDPEQVQVEEAMSQDVFTVSPKAPLSTVARTMAEHKYGSAVVIQGMEVVGIFTTVDALRALDAVLSSPPLPPRSGRRTTEKMAAAVKQAAVQRATRARPKARTRAR